MSQKPKIVIIGAGSVIFGLNCIRDAFVNRELWGSEIVLVDIDAAAVERMSKAAQRINRELGAGSNVWHTTDRREALPGADFVIVSVAVDRIPMWKLDFAVPRKYGIRHVLGENAGPGAVFHTLRNIPIILDICRDVEMLCPNALLINFTNPESRICMAIQKYTKVKAVGLCHQIRAGIRIVAKMIGRHPDDIDVKAWGLNHFTWMHDIRDKRTGEDLLPLFREKEKSYDPEYEKLSRFLFRRFGLFPASGDGHLGEFFPYAHEMMKDEGYDYERYEKRRNDGIRLVEGIGDGSVPLDENVMSPSGERAFDIIKGIVFNTNQVLESVNVPNNGLISNLPADAIVEVPAVVSGGGVRGIALGELPAGIASLCQTQINVQKLVVEAGVTGNKDLVLQAMLVDPNVPSANAALRIYEELMEHNKPYLRQFQ